jgi:hypothetical protein
MEKAMRCNFRITQYVEFNGAFGILDVHNAYGLSAFDLSPDQSDLRMAFEGNQYLLKGRPQRFELVFHGASLVEVSGLPKQLSDLAIHEIGFMNPDDRDYQWMLDDGVPGEGKHMVFKGDVEGEDTTIRVAAEAATVTASSS